MIIDAKTIAPDDMYKLLIGTVLPRPIAWVGSVSADGVDNLAPYSFFNVASTNPPVFSINFSNKPDGSRKDSLNNILETKYFSVSMVSSDQAKIMHDSGQGFDSKVDEFEALDIQKQKCPHIPAPRVADAKVSYECKFRQLIEFGNSCLLLGDILSLDVDDEIIDFPKIDMHKLDLVGRASGPHYVTTRDFFTLNRK